MAYKTTIIRNSIRELIDKGYYVAQVKLLKNGVTELSHVCMHKKTTSQKIAEYSKIAVRLSKNGDNWEIAITHDAK